MVVKMERKTMMMTTTTMLQKYQQIFMTVLITITIITSKTKIEKKLLTKEK
jgi:hypothetical protein